MRGIVASRPRRVLLCVLAAAAVLLALTYTATHLKPGGSQRIESECRGFRCVVSHGSGFMCSAASIAPGPLHCEGWVGMVLHS